MNLRAFVSGSAVVLMGWLMLSFLHRNAPQRYPHDIVTKAKPGVASPPAPPAAITPLLSAVSPSP